MWRALPILLLPFLAHAQIEITEIMYDPFETDAGSGGEWIEVYNTGSSAIDLTQWVFFENETNHGIVADGSSMVPASGYAVISRDLVAFKSFFNNFGGVLFKASFSLNDGELLAMKSGKDASYSDSVSYLADWGAKNDGRSLQKENDVFVASAPTPGAANNSAPPPAQSGSETNSETSPVQENTISNSSHPVESKIKTSITAPVHGIAGVEVYFKASTVGLSGDLLPNARNYWSFGDGGFAEGQSVVHVFTFPGNYTVVLEASSDEYAASNRHRIEISEPAVSFKKIMPGTDGFVELANGASAEIDLSYWQIRSGGFYFVFPKNTFISPMSSVIFPNSVTGLSLVPSDTYLLYPSGFVAIKSGADMVREIAQSPVASAVSLPVNANIAHETVSASEPEELVRSSHDEPVVEKILATSSPELAAVILGNKQTGNNFIWFGMMGMIIILASGGYFLLVRKKVTQEINGVGDQLTVRALGQEYKIIEEE